MNNREREYAVGLLERQILVDASIELRNERGDEEILDNGEVRYRANRLRVEYTQKGYIELAAQLFKEYKDGKLIMSILREKMKEQ